MSNWLQIYNYFPRNCAGRVFKQIKAPTEVSAGGYNHSRLFTHVFPLPILPTLEVVPIIGEPEVARGFEDENV